MRQDARCSLPQQRPALGSEAELAFESAVRRPGVFDGRGVDHGGVFGVGRPVGWSKLVVGLDRDATIGDVSERRCDAQVVHEPMPCGVVAVGMVEMVFEPACLVTPDGAACGTDGYRPEDIEVGLGGLAGELKDAVDAGAGERGVEMADVAVEGVTFGVVPTIAASRSF